MGEIVLKAKKFHVERRQVRTADGTTVDRELVVHGGAVLILPILDERTVVMIRNYRFSVSAELLELPAGTLEKDEDPCVCALRELEEETGFRAEVCEPLGQFYTSPGFTNELMYCFVARKLKSGRQQLDDTEQIRVVPMDFDDALAATLDGRIVDGKTIAALQLFHYRGTVRK